MLSHPIDPDKEDRMRRQLVTLGSTGLTETQSRYSTVELETLALVFTVPKLDYYLRYSSHIKVFTESRNLSDYWKMALPDIKNNRIQKMLEKLRPYAMEIVHVRGETNFLPDLMSRSPIGDKEAQEFHNYTAPSIRNKSYRY